LAFSVGDADDHDQRHRELACRGVGGHPETSLIGKWGELVRLYVVQVSPLGVITLDVHARGPRLKAIGRVTLTVQARSPA
jgi:hypothetical protein